MRKNVAIHSTAIVAPDVEIGPGTVIGPYAVVLAPCRIGANCWIGPHTVLGTTSEHTKYGVVQRASEGAGSEPDDDARRAADEALWFGRQGEGVEIGDDTIIREQSTVQSGALVPTRLGSRLFLMNKIHVGHDCQVADEVRMAPFCSLAGHVDIGVAANLGMATVVHQWRAIGAGAMVGMNATITRDAPPYSVLKGSPARASGVNRHLLTQRGVDEADIAALERHLTEGGDRPLAFAAEFTAWESARQP